MAAFLVTENKWAGFQFHVGEGTANLIARGFESKIQFLQVDCDELCRAASILYNRGIPWTHQQRVVKIFEPKHIALILYYWNNPEIKNGIESYPIITG